jgi:hypothetical protein
MGVIQGYYDSKEETDTKGNGMGVIQGYCDSKQQTDTKEKGICSMFDYMPFPNHNKAISLYILINKSFERCVAYLIALYNTHSLPVGVGLLL